MCQLLLWFGLGFFSSQARCCCPGARWQGAAFVPCPNPPVSRTKPPPHRELKGRRWENLCTLLRNSGAERSSCRTDPPQESPAAPRPPGSFTPSRIGLWPLSSRWDSAPSHADPSGQSLYYPQVQCREDLATGPEHPLSKQPSIHRDSPNAKDEASPSNPSRE